MENNGEITIEVVAEARKLHPYQEELHRALLERDSLIASIYMGALGVLDQKDNPDRIAQSAHSIREVMDRLVRTSETPIEKKGPDTNSLMQPIADAWENLIKGGAWPGTPAWTGSINPTLKTFLRACEKFIPKIREARKKAKAQASDIIESHNFHELSLPAEILESRSSEWMAHRKFFVDAAHHVPVDDAQIRHRLTLFEEFLLNMVRPRTFAVQKNIKKMIEEAERANS